MSTILYISVRNTQRLENCANMRTKYKIEIENTGFEESG